MRCERQGLMEPLGETPSLFYQPRQSIPKLLVSCDFYKTFRDTGRDSMQTQMECRPLKHKPEDSEGQFKRIYTVCVLMYYLGVVRLE